MNQLPPRLSETAPYVADCALLVSRFSSSGQWDRVLEAARDWLSRNPQDAYAHLAAGRALFMLGRKPQAQTHLAYVLAVQPQNDGAHRLMSAIQFDQKRFGQADKSIRRAIELNPEDPYHWYQLALMFHSQHDLSSAKKYAEKARELAPRNSDILNLLALCETDGLSTPQQFLQYLDALELDPENPQVHNNLGVYYLHAKDYRLAEESFRRALFFKPSFGTARANLFAAIKHRDLIYRLLCLPSDGLVRLFFFTQTKRRQSIPIYLALLALWLFAFRILLGLFFLWCLLVMPLLKAYEYLTLGDLLSKAGEIGARRGGLFSYKRWPVKMRLAIFAVLLVALWAGIFLLLFAHAERLKPALFGCALTVYIYVPVKLILALIKNRRFKRLNRQRAAQMMDLMPLPSPAEKP